jgi:thiol-disulfide isomerase/thioredoxin
MKQIWIQCALTLLSISFSLVTFAQERAVTLRIGDPAPGIKYSKWLKGEPLASFKRDHLYILEFWATWCGPCRAAMPHLTELQQQYKGKVTIIGVNIWEDKKKGQPYESFLPLVETFVQKNQEHMGYSVMVDHNDQYMGNYWMHAAGQEGIPSTFLIQDGKVIWIGNPTALDSTLPEIIAGRYNMAAYKEAFEQKDDASQKLVNTWLAATKPVQEALSVHEYKRALELIENAMTAYPDLHYALKRMKFVTLLKHVGQEEAIAFGDQWQKEDKNAVEVLLSIVASEGGLSKGTYLWAAHRYEKAGLKISPFNSHLLATAFAKGGNFKKAIIYEEKAVTHAEQALKEAKVGAMTEEILSSYKQTLVDYRKVLQGERKPE